MFRYIILKSSFFGEDAIRLTPRNADIRLNLHKYNSLSLHFNNEFCYPNRPAELDFSLAFEMKQLNHAKHNKKGIMTYKYANILQTSFMHTTSKAIKK